MEAAGVHVPPNTRIRLQYSIQLFAKILSDEHLIILGDFTAHLTSHTPYKFSGMGKILADVQDHRNLIFMNDDKPTHISGANLADSNVLDLILMTSKIAGLAYVETFLESGSLSSFNHLAINAKNSVRICIKRVD